MSESLSASIKLSLCPFSASLIMPRVIVPAATPPYSLPVTLVMQPESRARITAGWTAKKSNTLRLASARSDNLLSHWP